ncbi:MAG: polyphosphate polymerase domain-containing protein [Flavobacteriales bacterium]|nr:polyphosphate polymerase domain-containing protein [Flavobacteriales bacterium]
MRFEIKYIVPESKIKNLREMLKPFVRPDKYILDRNRRSYTVRSVYFDTPDLLYYREKIEGVPYRLKLRIRTYNTPRQNAKVFFEIKRKHRIPMTKDRASYSMDQTMHFLRMGEVDDVVEQEDPRSDNTKRFLYHLHRDNLHPTVLVVYDREAYESVFDNSVRITLDKRLRSAVVRDVEEIYREDLLSVMQGFFILEVKYNKKYPEWMRLIVNSLDLKQQAASKYCMSMENHPEIFHMDHWTELLEFKKRLDQRA